MLTLNDISFEQALEYYGRSISALLVVDENTDSYRSVVRKGIFLDLLDESGTYANLVQKLWFHHNDDGRKITDTYNVFIPNMSKFTGKNSRRLKLLADGIPHIVQMLILPLDEEGRYLFFLDELDKHVFEEETETENKVSSIQNNIYVFTMTFDLANDTTRSVSLTEVADEPLNYQISYSEWRKTIVNMVPDEDKELFLTRSDPDYLRAHFKPGHMESFDLQMINLDGIYQWVKLIFSRMETTSENDYRFVYMVQNIHESTMNMKATLKHYEELASTDPLTSVFNHGRIETELRNAVEKHRSDSQPAGFMILDIDFFKKVNDRYGHAVGDATLVHLSEIIKQTLADRNAAVGRWGGEEFAVVVYGEDEKALLDTAELIRTNIESSAFDVVGSITCSIGVTSLRPEDVPDTLFKRADHALYTAKSSGRNCVCSE
ncbi:MAG: GGDEF domain-containing protein [Ruminococcus sp.]|nr:GGDEF domain-containing protein [Ruminococcus sp.]